MYSVLQQATVEAVKELIKKHEEFDKRMQTNDDKINQMMQFADRLNDENHYASDKITEKARSIDERWVAVSYFLRSPWLHASLPLLLPLPVCFLHVLPDANVNLFKNCFHLIKGAFFWDYSGI